VLVKIQVSYYEQNKLSKLKKSVLLQACHRGRNEQVVMKMIGKSYSTINVCTDMLYLWFKSIKSWFKSI